ncbi:MAG: hypothetical protein QM660_10865 [Dysgonomonas sp.]
MKKRKCASVSDLWWNFDMKDSLLNLLQFILGIILLPLAYIYVKINNTICYFKNK